MTGKTQATPPKTAVRSRKPFTTAQRGAILRDVRAGTSIHAACRKAGIAPRTEARYRANNPHYARQMQAALERGEPQRDGALKFTADVRDRYLDCLRDGMKLLHAAHDCGIHPDTVRDYRLAHPDFDAACDRAQVMSIERVYHSMMQGAIIDGNPALIRLVVINKIPTEFRSERLIGVGGITPDGRASGDTAVVVDVDSTATTKTIADALLAHGPTMSALAGMIAAATVDNEP